MAHFNLNDYETVEQRHARAIAAHPDLRCVIDNVTTADDRAKGMWVVKASVYLNAKDQAAGLPKAVDYAFEIDGKGMANATSALENAATSALGRALRWALAGSKGASREEMEKVQRGVTPKTVKPEVDWAAEIGKIANSAEARALWTKASKAGADKAILDEIAAKGSALSLTA